MNSYIISLPKIPNNISEIKKLPINNFIPLNEASSSKFNINKIKNNFIYKTKFKMKIKKEFIDFQNSNKFLLNDRINKLIINNPISGRKRSNIPKRKLSSFDKSNTSKFLRKQNTFYKYFGNN